MKRLLTLLILLMFPCILLCQQSQKIGAIPLVKFNKNVNLPLSPLERSHIIEVYGDLADKYVFNIPHRLKSIKNILRNRVVITEITNKNDVKPCLKLSQVPLFDGFVSTIERDTNFNPQTFNPLKYNFPFYEKGSAMFQVDNTNYYIIIKSQH